MKIFEGNLFEKETKSSFLHIPGFTDLITKIYPPWPIEDFEPDFDTVYVSVIN